MRNTLLSIMFVISIVFLVGCSGTSKNTSRETTVQKEKTTKKEATTTTEKKKEKIKIAIDPGHQAKQMTEQEPIGPGASETKQKVSSGTSGAVTGNDEYQINLDVSLELKSILQSRGYDVVMIRETNNVTLSNRDRAKIANKSGAKAFLRIHCNSDESSSVKGALTMCPTKNNSYCKGIISDSRRLSEDVLKELCNATGAKDRGVSETDIMSGINWCEIPVTIIEMGFMSNPSEDRKLGMKSYQKKLATGIANGLDEYLKNEKK